MTAVSDMRTVVVPGVVCLSPAARNGDWVWRCDCGATFERRGAAIRLAVKRHGRTSCGCSKAAASRQTGYANRKHGASVDHKRLYDVHRQMHRRCTDPRCKDFPDYGARGISVVPEWADVAAFVCWALVTGYAPGLTIDRIDTNGPYSPGNCRWATSLQQAQNKRTSALITFRGETLTAAEWARRTGVPYTTITVKRRRGVAPERILAR